MFDPKTHWDNIYKTKSPHTVSWYTPHLAKSLDLIRALGLSADAHILDVGAGASTLPEDLFAEGFKHITVLDISSEALKVSAGRLGNTARQVHWIEADVTRASLQPDQYDLWHDRAVFHFLTTREERRAYIDQCGTSLKRGGYVLMATFGPNGPLQCSGLGIVRYSPESLEQEFGKAFRLETHCIETHHTPFETTQEFLYCLFQKLPQDRTCR
ncbi:MAG: methyltransferase [Omnitrophica bacterium RIFCSPHIGHO2_02_FULL_63_14]|nr:MAG: methyltransferase [Omnitrophica bacterium RIFCSPHIGHO2_02_FULL_63_14]